ncbi:MAG: hypothetical protein P8Z37_06460 [Acidobacteriota bacterium]
MLIALSADLCFGQEFKLDTSMPERFAEDAGPLHAYQLSLNRPEPSFNKAQLYEVSAFGGPGVVNRSSITRSTVHFGVDVRIIRPYYGYKVGMLYEIGYAGPINHFKDGAALFSGNYLGSAVIGKSGRFLLFGTVGYTVLFGTEDAINYGVGIDIAIAEKKAIRIEARDYLKYEEPFEHNVALRAAYVMFSPPSK